MCLAEHLGKFHWEILSIPADEFDRWVAYFKIKHREQNKQQNKKGSSEPPRPLRKKGG